MSLPKDGKLVRDRIPEIIGSTGSAPRTVTIGDDDRLEALHLKLDEECRELKESSDVDALAELGDVLEVLRAIASTLGHDWADVEAVAEAKAARRGRFANGTWLLH